MLSKKSVISSLVMLFLCITSTHANQVSRIYVSSSEGNDSWDGQTSAKPVKTIKHALSLGDTILLKAGDVFYESVSIKKGIIGRYSTGPKPMLCGWKRVKRPLWQYAGHDIWWLLLSSDNFCGFSTTANPQLNNIGCIHEYDKNLIHGRRVQYKKELQEDWDMWQTPHHTRATINSHDYDTLYIKYKGNPNKLKVEFSVGLIGLIAQHCKIEDVRIEGFAQGGISAKTETIIRKCEIDAIGGMTQLNPSEFVSLGNGIEFWVEGLVENSKIEDCVISRCYDCGMSIQGWTGKVRNIEFKNNVIIECCQGWEDFLNGDTNEVFENCYFRDNIVVNSGKTNGFNYPSNRRKYCHVLSGNNKCNRQMIIENNYFVGGNYYCAFGFKGGYKANVWNNNTCVISPGNYLLSNYDGSKDVLYVPTKSDTAIFTLYRKMTGDNSTRFIIKNRSKVRREVMKLKRKYLHR